MGHLKRAQPLISTVALLISVWLSFSAKQTGGSSIPSFVFLLITAAIVGAQSYFVWRERRPPEIHPDFVENIPGLGWTSASNGQITSMSSRMRDFLNVTSETLAVPSASIHPEDRNKTMDLWDQQQISEKRDTHRLLGPDGRYHWFRSAVHPIRNSNGAIIGSWGTFIEIGDLKAAEDALRTSQDNFRSILDHIPGNIVTADGNGVNDYCNRHAEIFYGHGFHEINGSGFKKFIHPDDLEKFIADIQDVIARAVPMNQVVRQRRHDGVYRWFRMRVNPAFNERGEVVRWYGLHIDIDDEVKALESLQDAQDKLGHASGVAGLAELAASIAHEVNQPLAAVVTNSEACQVWLSANPPNHERARTISDRIVRDAKEAAEVVRRIRELFAQKAPHKGRTNINELIEDVVHLIEKKYSNRGLVINKELDEAMPLIMADRIQLQQVVFNILRNGVEAMRSNVGKPMALDITTRVDGDIAIVEVRDNGIGLADPHKVFEPFFTTKPDGMGMGLSICRSIVDAHGGRLWAEAPPSGGALFSFELPVQDAVFLQDRYREESPHELTAKRLTS